MFSCQEIAAATGGVLHGADQLVTGVTTDSRRLQPGDLFVALRGERFDGHNFIPALAAAGVRVAVADRAWAATAADNHPGSVIVVADTLRALGDLAALQRRRFDLPVVGVTGSNGKTTVKEMLAAILALTGPGLKTEGNLNNLIGLPQMLFRLTAEDRWAVLEMGMSEIGEIDRLAEIAAPAVGIITNVNAAHLASMESLATVARAKGELFLRLQADGCAIYNADDPLVAGCPIPAGVRRVGFGLAAGDITAREIVAKGAAGQQCTLVFPDGSVPLQLPVPGRHNLVDALAAAAAAWTLGVSTELISRGLASFVPYRQRFNLVEVAGVMIVDDSYNANPASMAAALATFAECAAGSRRFAVLGEMRELGADEIQLHQQVGTLAATTISRLLVLGDLGHAIADGARAAGLAAADVQWLASHEEAVAFLASVVKPGDWVLVKGSRGMVMEQVVNGLRTRLADSGKKGA